MGGLLVHVTFLLGNGFDIQAGLNTKYNDFYNYLQKRGKEEESSLGDNIIFSDIQIAENEEKWSNFEMGLMELTKDCVPSNEASNIMWTDKKLADDKHEIEKYLGEYLNQVSTDFNVKINSDKVITEFKRSFSEIFSILRPQRRDEIKGVLPINDSTNAVWMNIIDFNYTSLFKDSYELLDSDNIGELKNVLSNNNKKIQIKKRNYVKLHGDTTKDMNLGGNDDSQLGESMKESELGFYFIKSDLDENIGYKKYKIAKNLINSSSLYCVLGMSLGETDKSWWENIANTMVKNTNKAFIIFEYDPEEFFTEQPLLLTTGTRRVKDRFLSFAPNLSESQKKSLWDRIFVVFNSKLFNLSNLNVVEEEGNDNN
jgi:hypothetical protein